MFTITIAAAGSGVSRYIVSFCLVFGPKTGSRRAGRGLKRSLEAVGFVPAEFQPKRSHGDPIRYICRANFQDAISRNIIDEQNRFF